MCSRSWAGERSGHILAEKTQAVSVTWRSGRPAAGRSAAFVARVRCLGLGDPPLAGHTNRHRPRADHVRAPESRHSSGFADGFQAFGVCGVVNREAGRSARACGGVPQHRGACLQPSRPWRVSTALHRTAPPISSHSWPLSRQLLSEILKTSSRLRSAIGRIPARHPVCHPCARVCNPEEPAPHLMRGEVRTPWIPAFLE